METWHDLWNPAAILAMSGAIGLAASAWPAARRGMAPWSAVSLCLALSSWSDADAAELSRGAVTVSLIWAALLLVLRWPSDRPDTAAHRELPLLFVLLAGLCLMTQAGDVVTLFLGLQLVTHGISVLTSWRHERPVWDARAPLPWLLLLGFVLLVAVTGSTRIETISEALRTSYAHQAAANFRIAGGGSRVLTLSVVLIGTALAGYAVCVPFHFQQWSTKADALGVETHPMVLLLPRAAVLIAWAKLWPATIIASESTAQLLIGVLAAITGVVPLLLARVERSLSRQWGLLAVAQGGWLLLAVTAWSFGNLASADDSAPLVIEWNLPTATQAAWLLLLLDGVALIGLCGVLTHLRRRERPVDFVDDLRGLLRCESIAAVCASVCLLSLSGLPLLAGFWSRLFVALAAMNVRGEWGPPHLLVPHEGLMLLTALLGLCSAWSASIAMRSVWTMLFGLPLGQPRPIGSVSSLFAAVLASLMLIGCGVLPGPLLSWLCSPRVEQRAPRESRQTPAIHEHGGAR